MSINYSSPGISVVEKDVSLTIESAAVTVVGGVGEFSWGAAFEPLYPNSETDLQTTVGKPIARNAKDYVSAANVLTYTRNLTLVRALDTATAKNSTCDDAKTGLLIENRKAYDGMSSSSLAGMRWVARYAGTLGDGIVVSLADANTFENWKYAHLFPSAPATSPYAARIGAKNDEVHVVVVDVAGLFTGVPGTVLETYQYLSKARDGKSLDLNPTFFVNRINTESEYVYFASMPITSEYDAVTNPVNTTDWGKSLLDDVTGAPAKFKDLLKPANGENGSSPPSPTNPHFGYGGRLGGGSIGDELDQSDYIKAWNIFRNAEETAADILYLGAVPDTMRITIAQHIIDKIVSVRNDCVLVVSPKLGDVLNQDEDEATKNVIKFFNDVNRQTSYGFMTSNWTQVYENHTDAFYWIPDTIQVAGLMARVDETDEPWFSPAGYNRGVMKNVVKLAWNPSEQAADKFYPYSVNRVFTARGMGTVLFGDRTMITRPSYLRQIGVRRLLIQLTRLIRNASRYSLFEFNDSITRRRFVSLVTPLLQQVQALRGLQSFQIVCDESNNTPKIIDNQIFVADIYILPLSSINRVLLSFVITNQQVSFTEIQAGG